MINTSTIQALVGVASAAKDMSLRELRVFVLGFLGYMLFEHSDKIALWMGQAALSPVLFKAGLIAFAMALARVLMRIFFPWLDLGALTIKAAETPLSAGIVAASMTFLVTEMFKLLAVT